MQHRDFGSYNWMTKVPSYVPSTLHSDGIATYEYHWEIKCASELYHSVKSQMIEDIEGTEVIMDDILMWGRTMAEHDQRLKPYLRVTQEVGD